MPRHTIHVIVCFGLVAVLQLACLQRSEEPPIDSVVLIVVDTLRADYVGLYEDSQASITPAMDALGESGVVFEHAVAPSSWTRSSMASLFTSLYPTSTGALGKKDSISDRIDTVAEVMSDAGWTTLAVSTNANSGAGFGFAQGFDEFVRPTLMGGYEEEEWRYRVAEGVTEQGLELIDSLSEGESFFLYVHYVDPHDPYVPHPELSVGPEPPGRFDGSRTQLREMDRLSPEELTDADRERIRYLYAGEVAYSDLWIGRLLDGLRERGLLERSLVVLTSDHGEGLWDHDYRAHGSDLYEEMTHVPLIVHPRPVATSARVARPVSLVDVAPTILAAVGLEAPSAFVGRDLFSAPTVDDAGLRVYSEMELNGIELDAVRSGSVKLIRNRKRVPMGKFTELYDLEADPGEHANAIASSEANAHELMGWLDAWRERQVEGLVEGEKVELAGLDAATIANLRALGYLEAGESLETATAKVPPEAYDFKMNREASSYLRGFYEQEPKAVRRWMAGRASARLRGPAATQWRLDGWIDLNLHEAEALQISVTTNGAAAGEFTIDRNGSFQLEGPVVPGVTAVKEGEVILGFTCDRDFVPKRQGVRSGKSLCVMVDRIDLF